MYDYEQTHGLVQAELAEETLQDEKELLKLVQREQHRQTENLRRRLAERNKNRMNRSVTLTGVAGVEEHRLLKQRSNPALSLGRGPNDSFLSSGRSSGGSFFSQLQLALSRLGQGDAVEGAQDVEQLVETLNREADLPLKQARFTKLVGLFAQPDARPAEERKTFDARGMVEGCRNVLRNLQLERDKAVELCLEQLAEDRFAQTQEITAKFARLLALLKNSKDPKKEEKIEQYEAKKQQELAELQQVLTTKKAAALQDIKDLYRDKCRLVSLDTQAFIAAIRENVLAREPKSPTK